MDIRPPVETLKALLATLPDAKDRLTIVLSSVSDEQRNAIIDNFPNIQFVLGGDRLNLLRSLYKHMKEHRLAK